LSGKEVVKEITKKQGPAPELGKNFLEEMGKANRGGMDHRSLKGEK